MDSLAPAPDALLRARYAEADGLPALPDNTVIETLLRHRSVRAYLPTALPDGTLETLVAAAQSAATSSNLQTWSVVAVEHAARRDRLARLAADQGFIRQAPLFLAWVADLSRLERLGTAHGTKLEGLDYLETFMVALIDAALAAQNAVVAAEALGLGTVYVGALRNHPEAVAAELGLPSNAMAAFGLAVGYPDPAAPSGVKPRLPQRLVLHREQYVVGHEADAVARYDAALSAFSEAHGMGRTAWTTRVLARVGSAAGLGGRDRMRQALAALGFTLR